MTSRRKILIVPAEKRDAHQPFFALMAALYPVEFVTEANAASRYDAAIVWAESAHEPGANQEWKTDTLIVAAPSSGPRAKVTKGRALFGGTPWLERCFRNQSMHEDGIFEFSGLTLADSEQPVCTLDSVPYWTCRTQGDTWILRVALGPPFISQAHTVYQHFNRRNWLRLLPFLHFIKRVAGLDGWSPPPLRACLMFDDPNLHWDSYGFIDFRTLARHAAACNYHAALAMVPADAWYFNPGAVQIFRHHAHRISLLMHGNDHTPAEFGAALTTDEYTRTLAQGLRRIDRFERRSGLNVARVMAPPHGAFVADAANPMLKLGYDAVCVSRSSLASWNDSLPWPSSFGHNVVEFLGEGFPAIPRHALAAGHEDTYRLAAFLDQPIIPHGHHRDCADGFQLLTRIADSINSLGPVVWSDMSTLARSNYQTRRCGDALFVRMLSRHVTLPSPEVDIRQIIVERPWLTETDRELLVCRQADQCLHTGRTARESLGITIKARGAINLQSPSAHAIDPWQVSSPPRGVWPAIRRVLSEVRDRVAPFGPYRPHWKN